MGHVGTYEIGLDTPIHLLTPRQLFSMQADWIADNMSVPKVSVNSAESDRWLVKSIGELAEILGTSTSTLYRMKSEGLLDEAISQFGKWMCIDVNIVLEKFRLSNRRKLMKIAGRAKRGCPPMATSET